MARAQDTKAKGAGTKPPTPSFTIDKPELKVEVGLEQKVFTIVIKGQALTDGLMKAGPLSVKDREAPTESKTKVEIVPANILERSPGKNEREWWVPVTVKEITRNLSERRMLRVDLGSLQKDLDYTITNLPASDFKWTITAPPTPWVIYGDNGLRLATPISTGAQAVSNVTISSRLVEERTHETLPTDALVLCGEEQECQPVKAGANSTVQSAIVFKAGLPAGKYSGPVYFSTPEKSGAESVTYSVHISSTGNYVAGVVFMVVGIWVGWIASSWATARVARLNALDLVAPVQKSIAKLANDWILDGEAGNKIQTSLNELARSLEEDKLVALRLLPPNRPEIFPSSRSEALQKVLDAASLRLNMAALVFERGWKDVVREPNPPQEAKKKALTALETLVLDGMEKDGVVKAIGDILTTFKNEKDKAQKVQSDVSNRTVVKLISQEEVRRAFADINGISWLLWGILTLAGGFYALILDKSGFGVLNDYLLCFFWGVGLPTAAEKLTPAGVLQTLRTTTPKS